MTSGRISRKPDAPAAKQRGRKGFRHASATVRKSVDQIVGRKGFAESEVLLRWPEIIGEALAQTCTPVKVHYGANRQMGATLILQTNSGRAPEVTHLTPMILERVNRFYGYRAINRVKVTQSTGYGTTARAVSGFAEEQTPFAAPESATVARSREMASELAEDIQDEGLRTALTLMGSHILARSGKKN